MRSTGTRSACPSLLLHICCGPCSTHVIESLRPRFDLVGFFYNPNIHPAEEYLRRVKDTSRVCRVYDIPLWIPPYCPEEWFSKVQGFENEPERGRRCDLCFLMRLEETARYAQRVSIPWIGTTLTVSPRKDATRVNEAGNRVAQNFGRSFVADDFKKNNGFTKSVKMSTHLGLYRQGYCGCCYSKI